MWQVEAIDYWSKLHTAGSALYSLRSAAFSQLFFMKFYTFLALIQFSTVSLVFQFALLRLYIIIRFLNCYHWLGFYVIFVFPFGIQSFFYIEAIEGTTLVTLLENEERTGGLNYRVSWPKTTKRIMSYFISLTSYVCNGFVGMNFMCLKWLCWSELHVFAMALFDWTKFLGKYCFCVFPRRLRLINFAFKPCDSYYGRLRLISFTFSDVIL